MGVMAWWTRKQRLEQAAREMLAVLQTGVTFEVGAMLSTDAEITQAVMLLRSRHPEVQLTLQSHVWVLSLGKTEKVSPGGWDMLDKGGYLPSNKLNPQAFLASHEAWMKAHDNTIGGRAVEKAEAQALIEEQNRHRIEVSSTPVAPDVPAVTEIADK